MAIPFTPRFGHIDSKSRSSGPGELLGDSLGENPPIQPQDFQRARFHAAHPALLEFSIGRGIERVRERSVVNASQSETEPRNNGVGGRWQENRVGSGFGTVGWRRQPEPLDDGVAAGAIGERDPKT